MKMLNASLSEFDARFSELADVMLKSIDFPVNPLKPSELIRNEARVELAELLSGKKVRDRANRGFSLIIQELSSHETPISINEISKELAHFFEKFMEDLNLDLKALETPENPTVFPISNKTIECFYQCGMRFYNHKKYQEASDIFFVISLLDYRWHNVWMALGLAEKELQHWDLALHAFTMAALMDLEDPFSYLYSSECYIALQQHKDAEETIEKTLQLVESKQDDVSRQLRESALNLKKSL